jgi:hypothetical protein
MVFCDDSTASIGIKILLSDLISQINESNVELIKKMLCKGCIEDSNGSYNEAFKNIVRFEYEENELPKEYLQCKDFLMNEFRPLFEKELLVPIKDILSTARWGYNRDGINSSSRPLDFDLSVSTEEYKEINHFKIVFFIRQHSE